MTDDEVDEFISLIDRSGGPKSCHLWKGKSYESMGGYGVWNSTLAHRVSWALKNGEIPEGLVVMHKCDNPPCVNPAHLAIGTHADNRADCVKKGRHAKGKTHGGRALTTKQAKQIREIKNARHSVIAERYGISAALVRKIRRGEAYNE